MYPITDYLCGAKAGDKIRLRRHIAICNSEGRPTGRVYHAGEIWTVLAAPAKAPIRIRLKQADGKIHFWSDDADFLAWFEKVEAAAPELVAKDESWRKFISPVPEWKPANAFNAARQIIVSAPS